MLTYLFRRSKPGVGVRHVMTNSKYNPPGEERPKRGKLTADLYGHGGIKLINQMIKKESKGHSLNYESIVRMYRFEQARAHNGMRFSEHSLFDYKYKKDKVHMFGNTGRLYGCIDDDYNSADAIQIVMEENMPEALILGDICHSQVDFYRLGELRYLNNPAMEILEGYRPQHTLARKRLNKFFQ